jgi:hypothetical protein
MQIPGKVSLDLVNARSKLSKPQYLTVLPDPGSIRAKQCTAEDASKSILSLLKIMFLQQLYAEAFFVSKIS